MSLRSFDLLANVVQALTPPPFDYVRSILGDSASQNPALFADSEFTVAQQFATLLPAAANVLLPSLPYRLLADDTPLRARPSTAFEYPKKGLPQGGERWLFVNGICTDETVVRINARYLHALFGRPLTVLHNNTCGVLADLIECALGKGWGAVTSGVQVCIEPLLAALGDAQVKRVVLIGHSQGTIISAVLLGLLRELFQPSTPTEAAREVCPARRQGRWLAWELGYLAPGRARQQVTAAQLKKLELYCFANCASDMQTITGGAPYIESYGNQNDIVARMGVLAGADWLGRPTAVIHGARYRRAGAWGHLLNAHYLHEMHEEWLKGPKLGKKLVTGLAPMPGTPNQAPRLFRYFGGANRLA